MNLEKWGEDWQGFWGGGTPLCPPRAALNGPPLACASSVKQAPPSRPGTWAAGLQSWNTEPLRHKEAIPSTGPLEPFIPDLGSCSFLLRSR